MSTRSRSGPSSIGSTEARDHFAELLGRVGFAKEHIIITRNGQKMGVFIPLEDYERLQCLEEPRRSDGCEASGVEHRT